MTRGTVTDQQGRPIYSKNPARVGPYYTIWLTGLGSMPSRSDRFDQLGLTVTNIPVYGYPGDTQMNARVSFIGNSPQFAGLNQINFQPPSNLMAGSYASGYPPLFPCGDYHIEVSLDLSAGIFPANLVQIPVFIKNGDVPCAK